MAVGQRGIPPRRQTASLSVYLSNLSSKIKKLMPDELIEQIAEKENLVIKNTRKLSGGSINSVYILHTESGDSVIKINNRPDSADMFRKEADGLAILKAAGAFKIPEVYGAGKMGKESYFLMEYLPVRQDKTGTWEDFAVSLAKLHGHTADSFGLDEDNYIGSLHQYNQSDLTHAGEFYIEKRLKPQFEMAGKNGFSFGNLNSFYENLKYHIPDEKPALIHGDLWNENYMLTQTGQPALIDPAVAYAPREMDLAMMELFGGF